MADLTPAQVRYLEALADAGERGTTCHQLAQRIYAGNGKMTTFRPSSTNPGAGAAGALGNLAAGRMMLRLWNLGYARRAGSYGYAITEAGAKALAAAHAEAAARAAQ